MLRALEIYGESTPDSVDCDLAACNEVERVGVLTFDRKLGKRLAI